MKLVYRLAVPAMLVAMSGAHAQDGRYNMQSPVTGLGQQVYDMHTLMLVICLVIFVMVFGVMFWAIFKHRKSRGAVAANFHENTTVEIAWTIIPVFVLVGMAWPATMTVLDMKDTSDPDITIKATGYQWKWGYDYILGEGQGIRFLSAMTTPREQIEGEAPKGPHYLLEVDNPLVVPVGKRIRIITTANDVIHAWWVPAFGVKQDAIPGLIRDIWFRPEQEGVYRGACTELCGRDHAFMPIEVHVVSEQEYSAWVKKQLAAAETPKDEARMELAMDDLMQRGAAVFSANCAACHREDGKGYAPAFPSLDGSAVVRGAKDEQIDLVLRGRPGTAMAAFGSMLSDEELAAVITYTRNAWSNRSGGVVQPAQIAAARGSM